MVEDDLQYGWSKWWFRQSTCCSPAINQDADPVHKCIMQMLEYTGEIPINHIIADTPVELVQIQSWVWIQYTRKLFACLLVKTNPLLRYLSLLTKTYCISTFNCISPCSPECSTCQTTADPPRENPSMSSSYYTLGDRNGPRRYYNNVKHGRWLVPNWDELATMMGPVAWWCMTWPIVDRSDLAANSTRSITLHPKGHFSVGISHRLESRSQEADQRAWRDTGGRGFPGLVVPVARNFDFEAFEGPAVEANFKWLLPFGIWWNQMSKSYTWAFSVGTRPCCSSQIEHNQLT